MHKRVYCVCIIYEHSTKSEELLYAFSIGPVKYFLLRIS